MLSLSKIIIIKGTKNNGFEQHAKEKSSIEYKYLKQIIDNNPQYIKRLVNKNEFCRYSDIRTYNDNKVDIKSKHGYINASWIHIPTLYFFIATQGPLESTIEDFWNMCFIYDIKIIIMICKLKENDKEKCANYWEKYFDRYKIINITEQHYDGLILRQILIKDMQNWVDKNVLQLQLTTWDDHTASVDNYKRIITMIKFINRNKSNSPVVVHCSAGVGRTGTFISIYNLYQEIMEQINDKSQTQILFSIMNTVRKLKELRMYSVENEKQYNFLYEFVNLLLKDNN